MISQLTGTITKKTPDKLVIDVHGVGFLVLCSTKTIAAARLGSELTIFTSLVVREDAMTLYGFYSEEETDAFELLQTTSGIGAKTALSALNTLSPDEIRVAVQNEDSATLCKIPGVGSKSAQRIIIELKDKVERLGTGETPVSAGVAVWKSQVMEALQNLGWSEREAEGACQTVAPLASQEPPPSVSELLKKALASLSRR